MTCKHRQQLALENGDTIHLLHEGRKKKEEIVTTRNNF